LFSQFATPAALEIGNKVLKLEGDQKLREKKARLCGQFQKRMDMIVEGLRH